MVTLNYSPEERALHEATRRRELVHTLNILRSDGLSQNKAAAEMGESAATLCRYRKAYESNGLEGLMPKFANCGRKPLAELSPEQQQLVQQLVVKSDPNASKRISVSFALRIFAHSDQCPDHLREVILKQRKSKHTITATLKRQARVRKEDKEAYRGRALETYRQPRDLTYMNEAGEIVPIAPGVCIEGDDMHFNEPFYVDWDDAADPCAAKYGVRAFRAQLIPWLDIGSGRFVAYSIVLRYSDAYRAKDLRWSLNHVFQSVGIPKILRLEMGAWKAKDVESIATDARVCKITHATSSGAKFIENRFNSLQKAFSLSGVQLGRTRGEFVEGNKLWMACRQGRKDPRTCLPSLKDVIAKCEAGLNFLNADPMEGELYGPARARELYGLQRWVPDEVWSAGLKEPMRRPTIEETWRLMPELHTRSISAGFVRVRCDEVGTAYWFHDPRFAELGTGWRVQVAFDPANPEQGAAIINAEPKDGARNRLGIAEGELLCVAENVDRVPQFNLSEQPGDTQGFERKKRYSQLCRLLYREIMPYGRSGGAVRHHARDGRGNVAEIAAGGGSASRYGEGRIADDESRVRSTEKNFVKTRGQAAGTGEANETANAAATRGEFDNPIPKKTRRAVTPAADPLLQYL